MDILTRLPFLASGVALVLAGYVLYQIPQRFRLRRDISLLLPVDGWIPFQPAWTWIYILAYYPFLATLIFLVPDWAQFTSISMSFLWMLALHILISFAYPVRVPHAWRMNDQDTNVTARLLLLVQKIDKGGNCFPSMHVAISVLSAFHLQRLFDGPPQLDVLIWCFPPLIGASTVLTKQHYFADVPAGVVLGGAGCIFYLLVTL